MNGCDHTTAVLRVGTQIAGGGIQPICSEFTGTQVQFPPRNEPFAFRTDLERIYRDVLRRSSQQTYVDVEGDIVWTQEYPAVPCQCLLAQPGRRPRAHPGARRPRAAGLFRDRAGSERPAERCRLGHDRRDAGHRAPPGGRSWPGGQRAAGHPGPQRRRLPDHPDDIAARRHRRGERHHARQRGHVARPSAVASSYYLLRLPSRQTTIPLTITLPTQVAASNFTIDYAVSAGGAVLKSLLPLTDYRRGYRGDRRRPGERELEHQCGRGPARHRTVGRGIFTTGTRELATGGELDLDSNAECSGRDLRLENIRWPTGRAPSGRYTVRVNHWSSCGNSSTTYVVRVINGGTSQTFTNTVTGGGTQGGAGSGTTISTFTR